MMSGWYKLVDKVPVKCESGDYSAFGQDRRVGKTILPDGKYVSTVFLGLDHNYDSTGPPILFETMVFAEREGFDDQDMERYATFEEAVQGHRDMVEKHGGRAIPTDFFEDDLFEL
jgi:hypothetical protein